MATPTLLILSSFILSHLLVHWNNILTAAAPGGTWDMPQPNIGITAMHMQLLHNDRVIIFDRTDFGLSNISLPRGKCRDDPNELVVKHDCTAHSVEYDVASNSIRPLMVRSDTWCSSGAVTPDGTLVQTGGWRYGDRVVRMFEPCSDLSCDWREIGGWLVQRRWYATNHILPDGRIIVIGGRGQFNYEFYPKAPSADRAYNLPFLVETHDRGTENNLYPFVFLNVDGNLFIFANNRAILFDYLKGLVVKTYPEMPGGNPRNYPSSGSAVLLPFRESVRPEVLVCGGAPKGAYVSAIRRNFVGALNTCGRIRISDPNPKWAMETMPMARVMGDMVMLPNGKVLIINGASLGTAGWELGRNPVMSPVVYHPDNLIGSRFEVQSPGSRPRMYHSTVVLLRDGRVLVAGSNPHEYYNFTNVLFPTDLTMETFSPSYLDPKFADLRPRITLPVSLSRIGYGQELHIQFIVPNESLKGTTVLVTMVAPPFSTHSFSMNQRLLVLTRGAKIIALGESTYEVRVTTPPSGNLAPPGYYMLFVVHQDVPSKGIWVQIK